MTVKMWRRCTAAFSHPYSKFEMGSGMSKYDGCDWARYKIVGYYYLYRIDRGANKIRRMITLVLFKWMWTSHTNCEHSSSVFPPLPPPPLPPPSSSHNQLSHLWKQRFWFIAAFKDENGKLMNRIRIEFIVLVFACSLMFPKYKQVQTLSHCMPFPITQRCRLRPFVFVFESLSLSVCVCAWFGILSNQCASLL